MAVGPQERTNPVFLFAMLFVIPLYFQLKLWGLGISKIIV